MAVALEIQGIISVVMAAMFVVAGAYLLSTIFIPSGEEYSIMAMRDIASHAKKIDKADSGDCSDFRIKVPSGFRINVEEKEIMIDTVGKGTVKSIDMKYSLSLPSKYDGDNDLNNPGNSFPINEDFQDTVDEEVCMCKKGSNLIMFPQPTVLGIVEHCETWISVRLNDQLTSRF